MNIEKGVEEFTSGCEHGRQGGGSFLFILAYFHLLQVNIAFTKWNIK